MIFSSIYLEQETSRDKKKWENNYYYRNSSSCYYNRYYENENQWWLSNFRKDKFQVKNVVLIVSWCNNYILLFWFQKKRQNTLFMYVHKCRNLLVIITMRFQWTYFWIFIILFGSNYLLDNNWWMPPKKYFDKHWTMHKILVESIMIFYNDNLQIAVSAS